LDLGSSLQHLQTYFNKGALPESTPRDVKSVQEWKRWMSRTKSALYQGKKTGKYFLEYYSCSCLCTMKKMGPNWSKQKRRKTWTKSTGKTLGNSSLSMPAGIVRNWKCVQMLCLEGRSVWRVKMLR
jgi:hypothetical protein